MLIKLVKHLTRTKPKSQNPKRIQLISACVSQEGSMQIAIFWSSCLTRKFKMGKTTNCSAFNGNLLWPTKNWPSNGKN